MKNDLRKRTTIVIEKDGEYLVGFNFFLRWSVSPYDAWHTRNREAAQMVADKIGGRMVLFNPVVNQLRTLERE